MTEENVFSVLCLADVYLLSGLKRLCARIVTGLLDTENVVTVLKTARLFNLTKLEVDCCEFISKNLEKVRTTKWKDWNPSNCSYRITISNSGSTAPIRFRIDLKTGIAMRAKKPFASASDWCKSMAWHDFAKCAPSVQTSSNITLRLLLRPRKPYWNVSKTYAYCFSPDNWE